MKYPFSPAVLDAMPEELAELFRELELTLLKEIAERLIISGQLNEVTVQDIRALRSHGVKLEAIKKEIAKATGIGKKKLDELMKDVVQRNQQYYSGLADMAQITQPETLVNEPDIQAIIAQTNALYRNITQSMGFLVGNVMLPPAKAYQWALDNAAMQVQSGAISYNQAIANATRELADGGLVTVDYESGHHDQADVAVRRAVMTGINQLNSKYAEQSMDYLGTEYVEVSAHSGARDKDGPLGWENHKAWQGKVYHWGGAEPQYPDFETTCGYGSVTGILGANCRHNFTPFIPGVMERTYTDEELANIDPPDFVYEGKKYTHYEATQKQREIERTIRKWKRREAAATDPKDKQAAQIRIRIMKQKYAEFSKAANLRTQPERMKAYVPRVDKSANSGIMKGSTISSPIEQRGTDKGNPNAMRLFDSGLNKRQSRMLEQLPETNARIVVPKKSVSMKDLAALTTETGHEFAMFTKGGERLIVRGDSMKVYVYEDEAEALAASGYRWSGHTHVGTAQNVMEASPGDKDILRYFNQEFSAIYNSNGQYRIFERE